MKFILLIISACVIVELFVHLPITNYGRKLVDAGSKAMRLISNKNISDHWKEKALLKYSFQIFKNSIVLFCFLFFCFSPLIVAELFGRMLGVELIAFTMTMKGFLSSFVIAFVYLILRKRLLNA